MENFKLIYQPRGRNHYKLFNYSSKLSPSPSSRKKGRDEKSAGRKINYSSRVENNS
jgi:hypothetical protein